MKSRMKDIVGTIMVLMSLVVIAKGVDIEFVEVANEGNAADTESRFKGAVAYRYRIGKYEITAPQYAEFLNAVCKNDEMWLWTTAMTNTTVGCGISRSGTAGNYTYTVAPGCENLSVGWISFMRACRFVNWLHNGKPVGAAGLDMTTEDGVYDLNALYQLEATNIVRKAGWRYAIPDINEWYKAAFYNPTTGTYFKWATRSSTAPGNVLPDTGNNANYLTNVVTDVGAFTKSASPYGTFDQTGCRAEWIQTPSEKNPQWHMQVGGGAYITSNPLHAAKTEHGEKHVAQSAVESGFRIIALWIPPGTLVTVR